MVMAHRSFREIGEKISLYGWGFDDDGNLDETIKKLSSERSMVCLLANLVHQVSNLDEKIEIAVKKAIASDREMQLRLKREMQRRLKSGDRLMPESLAEEGLSFRARKVIASAVFYFPAEIHFVSDLNEKLLNQTPGCGKKTKDEIMAWVRAQESRKDAETSSDGDD